MNRLDRIWPTLKRLLFYCTPWSITLFVAVMMLWFASFAEVSCPILVSYFINIMVTKNKLSIKLVTSLTIVYAILQFLAAILYYIQSLLFSQVAGNVVQKLRTDVMDAALHQPLNKFDAQPVGQVMSLVTNDTEVIRDLYVTVVATVLRSVALISSMLVAMFTIDWRMALVSIIIFPAVIVVMLIYQRYSTPIVRKVRSYLANISNDFNEAINGISVIQQFCQQIRFGQRIRKTSRLHYIARMQILRLDGFLLRPLLSLFSSLVLCGLLLVFSFTSISGAIEIGALYAFISYLGRLNEPLIELTSQQSMLQQAVVAGERVFSLIDSTRQQYGSDNRALKSGIISFKNVSFSYHNDDKFILQDINFQVPSGSFLAIVGHTGSGKSTIGNLLMGYYKVNHGEIFLDGRSLSTLSHTALRSSIAIVQQDPVILSDTFFTNITMGRPFTEEYVWSVLKKVQLAELVSGMHNGIYTRLGEYGNILSVGQKQLLSIARVLVEIPKILILDEATASIDSGTEQIIQQVLSTVCGQTTLVMITHRLSTIVGADTILVLHRGQIVERGNHQQLLISKGVYWKMYQLYLTGKKITSFIKDR